MNRPAARRLYLDNNATTPLHPVVAAAMCDVLNAGYANPASQHRPGQLARRMLEDAREAIGQAVGARVAARRSDRLLFTSGGTEANNLALFGLAGAAPGRILVSAIEHPSVLGPADALARRGFDVRRLNVSTAGSVDPNQLDELLTDDTRLVAVMLANNETGVVQPVRAVADRCRARGVPLHVDAAQAVGKLPVDFTALGATTMTVVPHKFHGPVGIAALVLDGSVQLQPQLWGGLQQDGLRPGTENLAAVMGFRKAIELWQAESTTRPALLAELRDRFESRIVRDWPEVVVVGKDAQRLPQVTNLAFPGFDRQALLLALDEAEVACSTGSACASGSSEPSPVLLAMGLPEAVVGSALRFSFNGLQMRDDADEGASRILLILRHLARRF